MVSKKVSCGIEKLSCGIEKLSCGIEKTFLWYQKKTPDLQQEDLKKLKYHEAAKDDEWQLGLVKEITDVLYGQQKLQVFERDMFNEILVFMYTTLDMY